MLAAAWRRLYPTPRQTLLTTMRDYASLRLMAAVEVEPLRGIDLAPTMKAAPAKCHLEYLTA